MVVSVVDNVGDPILDATAQLMDLSGKVVDTTTTDGDGDYESAHSAPLMEATLIRRVMVTQPMNIQKWAA